MLGAWGLVLLAMGPLVVVYLLVVAKSSFTIILSLARCDGDGFHCVLIGETIDSRLLVGYDIMIGPMVAAVACTVTCLLSNH